MKNYFLPFAKLAAVAACALTLGSCNRAEYAMLPKAGSYHGVTRVATPVPEASTAKPVAEPAIDVEAPAAVPAAAPALVAASAAPTAQPAIKTTQPTVDVAKTSPGMASTAATATPKPTALQRMALNKVTRKVDKLLQKSTLARQHNNTASTTKTSAIGGNLRIGLVLLLVGLLISLFNGLIGTIVALVGVIFIVLWLLDSL